MVLNPAWHLGASWTSPSRRLKRASAPGSASRIWTVGPQRPSPPTRIWTPCTRTASGNEEPGSAHVAIIAPNPSWMQTFQPNISAGGRKKPVHQVLHHWDGWRNVHLGCQGNAGHLSDLMSFVSLIHSLDYSTCFQTLESAMKNLKIVWASCAQSAFAFDDIKKFVALLPNASLSCYNQGFFKCAKLSDVVKLKVISFNPSETLCNWLNSEGLAPGSDNGTEGL